MKILFLILIILTTLINFKTGFYQKGLLPKTEVNLILGYFIKWMLLFGLTSITCLFIDFDYKAYKNISYGVIILFFLELCLSNLSLLSRSLIFSGSAILFFSYVSVSFSVSSVSLPTTEAPISIPVVMISPME